MARSLLRCICKICPKPSFSSSLLSSRLIHSKSELAFTPFRSVIAFNSSTPCWNFRNYSYGTINLVTSDGNPKFEINEIDPPKKHKWQTKKRLKLQRKKEKKKRRSANKRDPRRLGVKKGKKKQKFDTAEIRIKTKIEKARIKENLLIERLKRYEVDKVQGPVMVKLELSGEERFYMKKMAQKGSNYVPVGRRGIFGGVILNMHMHWKKHETVKVICKPCKPGQLQEYAEDIARLSGGIPIHFLGDDTIVFYRGKDYVQPQIMSPIDTLSKKRALEKSKYQQSLESVRRFIAIAEKELELYYRHIALYGNPTNRDPNENIDVPIKRNEEYRKFDKPKTKTLCSSGNGTFRDFSVSDIYSAAEEVSEEENEDDSEETEMSDFEFDSGDDKTEESSSLQELPFNKREVNFECKEFVSKSQNFV